MTITPGLLSTEAPERGDCPPHHPGLLAALQGEGHSHQGRAVRSLGNINAPVPQPRAIQSPSQPPMEVETERGEVTQGS